MASISKHPSDVVVWISRVIVSCNTVVQLDSASKLVELFYKSKLGKKLSWDAKYDHEKLIKQRKLDINLSIRYCYECNDGKLGELQIDPKFIVAFRICNKCGFYHTIK